MRPVWETGGLSLATQLIFDSQRFPCTDRGITKMKSEVSDLKRQGIAEGPLDPLGYVNHTVLRAIGRLENGQIDPRLSTLNKLLRALTEDVFDGTETIQRIMSKNIVYCCAEDTLATVSVKMLKFGYSMLPVFDVKQCVLNLIDS